MTLVSDNALARARASIERLHATTATHSRMSEAIATSGSVSQSWTSLGSIQCRVESDMGDTEQGRVMGAPPGDRPVHEYVVFTAHDADVRTGDRLTLASGIVLSVQQASRGQSQAFVQALYCTEVSS